MTKYKTANGKIVSEQELKNYYGDRFESLLDEGKFQEIDSNEATYITKNNKEVTESELVEYYGQEKFNEHLKNGDFKKKGDTELPSGDGSLVSQTPEEDYFTGTFGAILKGIDDNSMMPIKIGEFVDDISRSIAKGWSEGKATVEGGKLFDSKVGQASVNDINKYLEAQKNANSFKPSDEYQDFQRIYKENGETAMGAVLGLAKNPTAIFEAVFSSAASLAANKEALTTGLATIGTGALVGGGVPGALAALPLAFATASTVAEIGGTFAELLNEEVKGEELTAEKIQQLLNDPEVYTRIKNKAVARGFTIGAIEFFVSKLGGKIAGKILTKGGTQAASAATKSTVAKSVAAAGGIEAVGGSLGEIAGSSVIGQELNADEIIMEGIAEMPGSIKDFISTRYSKPTYKVNGEEVGSATLDNLIETMTLEQLQASKIKIENDYDGRAGKLQNKLEELSTKKQIQEANPEINEATLNEMTTLQLELNKLDGNKTEVAKAKASDLKEKIKALQETPLEEEVAQDEIPEVVDEVNIEEEFAQLTDEEKAPFLEQANGDRQSAINLFAEDTKRAQELYPVQETTQTEEMPQEDLSQVEDNQLKDVETTADAIRALRDEEGGLPNEIYGLKWYQKFYSDLDFDEEDEPTDVLLAKAYHKAKSDGSNPALVSGVENLFVSSKTQEKETSLVSKIKDFGRNIFGSNRVSAQGTPETEVVSSKTQEEQGASITNKPALDQLRGRVTDSQKLSIIDTAQKVITTLKSVLPNFDIIIHDSDNSYSATMKKINGNTNSVGNFSYTKNEDGSYVGRIDINLNKANNRTVAHEVAHGIMLKAFGESTDTFKTFKNRISSVLKDSSNKKLSDFASQYAKVDSYEEYLVELTAVLSQQEDKIAPSILQKIAAIINELVSGITNGKFTPFQDIKDTKQTIEFFNNISNSIRKGEAINTSEIVAETGVLKTLEQTIKSKAQLSGESKIVKFIKDARAQGISEAAIKITLRKNGVSNEDIVSGLDKSKGEASVRTEVTEDLIEGYDRMMEEVDGIVSKSEKRGRSNDEILNNITEYIMGSKVYENATDVQREKLVRDARKRMGKREKSAPSAKRLIGIIKDIKNITMSEKELLYNRLKALEEGAKTAKQAWMNVSKQLTEEIKELQKKGKITVGQMNDVLSKFSKVNMFNPVSVERFVDYMSKVFNDADYANKIENANVKRKNALANVGTKIGISDILAPKLQKLFSINPSLIPMSVLDKYLSLLNTFSQRKAVLSLPPLGDVIAMSDDVLNAIKEEESAVMELQDRFNSTKNKVYNDDGSLNYADTLKLMLAKEDITEDELELMKKYKSKILPKEAAVELTEAEKKAKNEEIEAKKKELIKQINESDLMQISSLPSRFSFSICVFYFIGVVCIIKYIGHIVNKPFNACRVEHINLAELSNYICHLRCCNLTLFLQFVYLFS